MKILIIAKIDHSGAGYALREAINNTSTHKARAITYKITKLKYPHDILSPSKAELQRLIKWADVLNIHDDAINLVGISKKTIITTYHGSWYRQRRTEIDARDNKMGYLSTALTIDLSITKPIFVGRAMPMIAGDAVTKFSFAHSPTQRHRKGTHLVIRAAGKDINLDLIEGISNVKCLIRKAKASAVIDQVGTKGLGYGTNAIEAWAMGIPVISSAPDNIIGEMIDQWGYVPFIRVYNAIDLRENMLKLVNDNEYWCEWQKIGVDHYLQYHSPKAVAKRFCELCTRL
jgi:hypothetical protein